MNIVMLKFITMTNKLKLPAESRMQGDLQVRFGGRSGKTYRRKAERRPVVPSLHVVYKDEPAWLSIEMEDWLRDNPEGGIAGDRMFVKLKELGGETPLVVNRIMYTLYKKNKRDIRHIGCKKYGIQTLLKGLYINNDLLYLHTSLRNSSDISFDIDYIRFKVVDKKVAKRTAM